MKKNGWRYNSIIFTFSAYLLLAPAISYGQEGGSFIQASFSEQKTKKTKNDLTPEQRKALAKSFLSRMKRSISTADSLMSNFATQEEQNILPEGEMLMFQPLFKNNQQFEGVISATVKDKKIMFSLQDMASVLELPIDVNPAEGKASGWYIREENNFILDVSQGYAKTNRGTFKVSSNVLIENDDIYLGSDAIKDWFEFTVKPDVSSQEVLIESKLLFPFQERYERRKIAFGEREKRGPELPRKEMPYKAIDVPAVDVSTSSNFRRSNNGATTFKNHNANIRTTGDFGYGTLTTQSLINNRDQLTNLSAIYKRESDKPELLGKLKARKFEIGDVTTARLPVGGFTRQELGARVTNIDPNKGTISPTTEISGTGIPGWDVELYREDQIIGFQQVDDDGFYKFDQITLFNTDNKFRVVFYGPQGELVEENVFVPVDVNRLAEGGGVYDVSLTLDDKQTYVKKSLKPESTGYSPNLVASYEKSLGTGVTGILGFRTNETDIGRDSVVNAGVSAIALQTLLNADIAVDDEGELLTEVTARRSFGKNNLSNRVTWVGEGFDKQNGEEDIGNSLSNNLNVEGPVPFLKGPRYYAHSNYEQVEDGYTTVENSLGVSGGYKRLSISEEITTDKVLERPDVSTLLPSSYIRPDHTVTSHTNLSGTYGPNRFRVGASYELKPESELTQVLASYTRNFNKKISLDIDWNKQVQQNFSEYSARLDWQAGFARISPRISYNTREEFYAGLNTRFGLLREPHKNDIKSYDRSISSNGGLSAFVFLDHNGDSVFNEGDEPIPDVLVQAPQNGGRSATDENGIAVFNQLSEARLTDVFLDKETLKDPSWVPGYKGASILPRSGYVAQIEFPVHMAGEIDGTVNLNGDPTTPLRNIAVSLYNSEGNAEQKVLTDQSGFYYFTRVPPGRYLLIIDGVSARRGNFIRPEPQPIEIGYEGTVLFGNDIRVVAGKGDVPSEIMVNIEDYKKRHPQIDFSNDNQDLVLNLGDYNSNLLMSVVWYKLRTRFAPVLAEGTLYVPPTESYADIKTGKHTLRLGLNGETIDGAYGRCRSLMARGQYCKVEIFPANMKQAKLEMTGKDFASIQ